MKCNLRAVRAGMLASTILLVGTAIGCDAGEVVFGRVQQATSFDWGEDCAAGEGMFSQQILAGQSVVIGDIPRRKKDVRIDLQADGDVDLRLYEKDGGKAIVSWPSGILNGPSFQCATYKGTEYCYSGYNGVGGDQGKEFIEIRGATTVDLQIRAFGYTGGEASVSYAWSAVDTCYEVGDGRFTTTVAQGQSVLIGTIPQGKANVLIRTTAARDVDIQLADGTTKIVSWPDGILRGPFFQQTVYAGMTIAWSGYAGDGFNFGNEYIRITGITTRELTMRVYGYAAGSVTVDYKWGIGAGDLCGASQPDCKPGFICKDGDTGDIPAGIPGTCHSERWCASDASAFKDCAGLDHAPVPGEWGCDQFYCEWQPLAPFDLICSQLDQSCPPGYSCEWGCPDEGPCGVNPPGVCLFQCSADEDCADSEYCSSAGLCRADATCGEPEDCIYSGNAWDQGGCSGSTFWRPTCESATCGFSCLPGGVSTPPDCGDVSGLDFGTCDMLLGYAPNPAGDGCVAVNGCTSNGLALSPTRAACEQDCL